MRREQRGEDVLRRCLPDGAGDRNDPRIAARADGTADRRERAERLVGDERRGRARRPCVVHELRAPPDRDEEVTRRDAARIHLHTGHDLRVTLETP